jgi:uncharacterized protein YjiS (DUF1127 family)
MRNSTDLDNLAALEKVAPRGVITRSNNPIVFLWRGSAGNDATCEDPVISKDEVEAWAQHTLAANGFGDAATTDTASFARLTSYKLHQAARAHRSFILGEIIVAAIRAAGAIARRAYARHRQRRQARATYAALQQLDDRTLRDLGFDRSEIRSVAAELTGEAEYTRVRASANVARSSEHSSSVTPPKIANPTIDPQEQKEKITTHRYETSTPRVAFGITAVAMTAITIGVLVVMPARVEADRHEPGMLASKITTLASTSAVTGATIDVVRNASHDWSRLRAHRPNRTATQQDE